MAISEFQQKRIEKLVGEYVEKRRPPAHLRDKADLSFRFDGRSVEIFEIRAGWHDSSVKIEESVAKATYVKAKRNWKIFWKRADLKWHRYDPVPEVETIEQFLDVVEKDHYGCFFWLMTHNDLGHFVNLSRVGNLSPRHASDIP